MKNITLGIISTILLGVFTNLLSNQIQYNIDKEKSNEIENKIIVKDEREIKLVDMQFATKEHKWQVRVIGLLIIVFPWFVSPLKLIFNEAVILALFFKFIERNPMTMLSPKYAESKFKSQLNIVYIPLSLLYIIGFYFLIYHMQREYDFSPLKYSLYSMEMIFNFILSLI